MCHVNDRVLFHFAIAIGSALNLHDQIRRADEETVARNRLLLFEECNADIGRASIVL